MPISGQATPAGSRKYAARFPNAATDHFKTSHDLTLSSIGLGTYLGKADDATDEISFQAALYCAEQGCNVFDTAINYRCQRSERVLGKVLRKLIEEKGFARKEFFISTKAGFIPFDGAEPQDAAAFVRQEYLEPGIFTAEEVAGGSHVLTSRYLEDQLRRSLGNLDVECVDLFFLHNPETQLTRLPRKDFLNRLRDVFLWLEEKVREGKIKFYGTATWGGYRAAETEPQYLSLQELLLLAREAAGNGHHFRGVQFPYNLTAAEALLVRNQQLGAGLFPLLEVCRRNDLLVMASASLLQGALVRGLPAALSERIGAGLSRAQAALQFVRSTPGITTALVGMKQPEHTWENMALCGQKLMSETEFASQFMSQV